MAPLAQWLLKQLAHFLIPVHKPVSEEAFFYYVFIIFFYVEVEIFKYAIHGCGVG